MIKTFLSRPNWVSSHMERQLERLYVELANQGFEAKTIGTNVASLASPFEEVVSLMKSCECTIVLGIPHIRINTGTVKGVDITNGFSLPTEWNQIEAAISIMLEKPTLMMLHKGVSPRGLFDRGAANIFVYEFHTLGNRWIQDTIPRLQALKDKVNECRSKS